MKSGKTILGAAAVVFVISVLGLVWAQEKQEKALPEKMSIALDGGVKMDFVLIYPGSFMMGSGKWWSEVEKPVHEVMMTRNASLTGVRIGCEGQKIFSFFLFFA